MPDLQCHECDSPLQFRDDTLECLICGNSYPAQSLCSAGGRMERAILGRTETKAHEIAQNISRGSAGTATVWTYRTKNGMSYAVTSAKAHESQLPSDALAEWRYTSGVPFDIRPKATPGV